MDTIMDVSLAEFLPQSVREYVESLAWASYWSKPLPASTIYVHYAAWATRPLSQRAFAHALRAEWRLPDRRVQAYVMYPSRPPLYIPAPAWREAAKPDKD